MAFHLSGAQIILLWDLLLSAAFIMNLPMTIHFLKWRPPCATGLLGCNPWGTSMIVGYPDNGDTPVDPHSAFTHLHRMPITGGLVDGPIYTSIFNRLIGIYLANEDEYAPFQSDYVVYHDDLPIILPMSPRWMVRLRFVFIWDT